MASPQNESSEVIIAPLPPFITVASSAKREGEIFPLYHFALITTAPESSFLLLGVRGDYYYVSSLHTFTVSLE